jgi:hypothetical protein
MHGMSSLFMSGISNMSSIGGVGGGGTSRTSPGRGKHVGLHLALQGLPDTSTARSSSGAGFKAKR